MPPSDTTDSEQGQRGPPTEPEVKDAHKFVTEDLDRSARWDTFSNRLPRVHERLVQAAESGENIEYGPLADYADTDPRRYMSKLLDGIGYIERQRNNPPLTVLAVHAGNGEPDDSFLDLLEGLGIRGHYSAIDEKAIEEARREVFKKYGEAT